MTIIHLSSLFWPTIWNDIFENDWPLIMPLFSSGSKMTCSYERKKEESWQELRLYQGRYVSQSAWWPGQRGRHGSTGCSSCPSSPTQRASAQPWELHHCGPWTAPGYSWPWPALPVRLPVWRNVLPGGGVHWVCPTTHRCLLPGVQCYSLCLWTDRLRKDVYNRRSQYLWVNSFPLCVCVNLAVGLYGHLSADWDASVLTRDALILKQGVNIWEFSFNTKIRYQEPCETRQYSKQSDLMCCIIFVQWHETNGQNIYCFVKVIDWISTQCLA